MRSNSEFVAQAIAAIPLWRAFLDKKEAEQDALLAEVLAEKPKPALLSSLTARFSRRSTTKEEVRPPVADEPIPIPITELDSEAFLPPIIEEPVADEDEKRPPLESDKQSLSWVTAPDDVPKVKVSKEDDPSEREAVLTKDRGKKEVVSSNHDDNDTSTNKQDLGEANQFQDLFN